MQRANAALLGICFLGATVSCSGGQLSVGERDGDAGISGSTGGSGSIGSGGTMVGTGGSNTAGAGGLTTGPGAGGMTNGAGGAGGTAAGGGSPDACVLTGACLQNYHFDPSLCRCVPDPPDAGCVSGVGGPCGGNTAFPCTCGSGLVCIRRSDAGLGDSGLSGDGTCLPQSEGGPPSDAPTFTCPRYPVAGDPCAWPADAECQYFDPCKPTAACTDTFRCSNGVLRAQVCAYLLNCPATMPIADSKCTCGTGHSAHTPGEGANCPYRCSELDDAGDVVLRCNEHTDLWELVSEAPEPAVCEAGDGGPSGEAGEGDL